MNVTEEDREKARHLLPHDPDCTRSERHGWACDCGVDEQRDRIAAALAAEREKARAPFLALADKFDVTVKRRYELAEKFMDAGRYQLSDGFRNLARQAATNAARIRDAADE